MQDRLPCGEEAPHIRDFSIFQGGFRPAQSRPHGQINLLRAFKSFSDQVQDAGRVRRGLVLERFCMSGGGIVRISPQKIREHKCQVIETACNRAGRIKRPTERQHAVSRRPAIGWLEAVDAAGSRGNTHRTAGIATEGGTDDTGGDGRCRSATAAACDVFSVVWVPRRPDAGSRVRRPESPFVHVRLAEDDGSCGAQVGHNSRIDAGCSTRESLGTGRGREIPCKVIILYRDRDAVNQAEGFSG